MRAIAGISQSSLALVAHTAIPITPNIVKMYPNIVSSNFIAKKVDQKCRLVHRGQEERKYHPA